MIDVLLKTLIGYFVLMVIIRLMGKRQLGEMQVSELISAFLISEIASAPVTNPEFPVLHALLSMLIILVLEIILPILTMKIPIVKKLFDGTPSYLVYNGHLRQENVKKSRMTIDELGAAIRAQGIADISKVQYAILETNGTVSIFPYKRESPITPEDMKIKVSEEGIAHNLIVDGTVNTSELDETNMSRAMLDKILTTRNIKIKDIFLMTIDDNGYVNIIKKKSSKKKAEH